MRQETEQEDCELRDVTGKRTGGLRTERLDRKQNRRIANWEMWQETEQEGCEQIEGTGNVTREIWKLCWEFCCIHIWERNICWKGSSGEEMWIPNEAMQHMRLIAGRRHVAVPIQSSDRVI
jgi:hypothetical protein